MLVSDDSHVLQKQYILLPTAVHMRERYEELCRAGPATGGLVSVTPLVTLTAVHGLLGERVVILVTHLLNHGRQQLQGEGGGREEGGREGRKKGGREGIRI